MPATPQPPRTSSIPPRRFSRGQADGSLGVLTDTPVTASSAAQRSALHGGHRRARGIQRGRMRSLDLDKSIWGVRNPDRGDTSLETRCAMFALRMPDDAVFSHATSALLFRAPLPFALEAYPRVHIAVPYPARAPHAAGILGHSLDLAPGDVVESNGLRHTSAARTWCDMSASLSLLDLVALGDYLI